MTRFPKGGAVIPTGTGFTHVTSGSQDAAARAVVASDSPELVQLIKQVHPTLQVLAAMDETTYSGVEKSGNNYRCSTETIVAETGASPTDTGNPGSANFIGYAKFTASVSISVTNLSAYIFSAVGNAKMALYTDVAGAPAALMNGSSSQALAGGWNTFTIASTALVNGVDYWVAIWFDSTGLFYSKVVASGVAHAETKAYGAWAANATPADWVREVNAKVISPSSLTGNILSNTITSDVAVLSFFEYLKVLVSIGTSSHATPVQAEIYGNADAYAAALNATTKFVISTADPRIILKRDSLDTITASSNTQTVWNLTVAGGLAALPNHGTILATEIGVASILVVEKSILGDFSDTVVLTESTDYIVDYSTRTATKVTLTSGTGIVNAQSKLRFSWIADVMKIGSTNNTILKVKLYLNRTNTGETSPDVEPIALGAGKYVDLEYGT